MITTFLYRIKGDPERYYGKYVGKCALPYEEGLDKSMVEILFPFFHQIYPDRVMELSDLSIGILSVERDGQDYYSEEEKYIFDLLYCNWSNQPTEIYLHGKGSIIPLTTSS